MNKRSDILFLIPSLTGFLVFFIIPFFYSFTYAFTKSAFIQEFVWFDNFIELVQNDYFCLAIKNTMLFTLCAVPLNLLLSVLVALMIVRYAKKIPFVKSAFFLPVMLPSTTIVMLWQAYINNTAPPFTSLLLIYLWKYSGLNIMLILTALSGMNKDMLDAARIDGAGTVRILWNISLPNIAPTIFFTFILSVVNSLKIFRESFLLYSHYPDDSVYMIQNYLNNHFQKLNYQNISTAAIIFAVIIYTIVAIFFAAEKKWSDSIW